MSDYSICPYDICTGCFACLNICGKSAISMKEGDLGHWYPEIDTDKCVSCGLCEKICPALHPTDLYDESKESLAAISSDNRERETSSSGGAASVICRDIIRQGGVVYGCAQLGTMTKIRHIRVDNEEELSLLKGSKYVQSYIGTIFKEVQKDLKEGRKVAFVGTPCQVVGLKKFLRKSYDHLLTLDLICHGVPPQRMLIEDAIKNGIKKIDETLVSFRWKAKYGIHPFKQQGIQYGVKYATENDRTINVLKQIKMPYDDYILAFMTGLSFRESCHTCPYSTSRRAGDITIGDFWGLGAYEETAFHIGDGVSLLLVNSPQGEMTLKKMTGKLVIEHRTLKEALNGNANLIAPSPRPRNKDIFKTVYVNRGLGAAVRTAVPRTQFLKRVIIEQIKQTPVLVRLFKSARLLINKLR